MRHFIHGDVQHVTKKPPCNTNLEVRVEKMFFVYVCVRIYTYVHVNIKIFFHVYL